MAYRFVFRPWASVATLMALAILIGLGVWQLERRAWKAGLIAEIAARKALPEVDLPARLDDPQAWLWRRVRVTGQFADGDLRWLNRTLDGAPGWQAIAGLRRAEAPPVLVDRGWLPASAVTAPPPPAGVVTLTGVVRPAPGQGWFQPDNDANANTWFWLAPAAMASALGLDPPLEVLVTADPPVGEGLRQAGASPELRDPHLDYALTWFSLAATLVVVFVLSSRRRA